MSLVDLSLVVLVTLAGLWDAQTGKIPNGLTYPAWGLALVLGATGWGDESLRGSLLGFGIGFLPFFLLYLKGGLGAGDVKLMAAVGALKGYTFVVNAMIASILVGGLIALLIVIWEGRLRQTWRFLIATAGRLVSSRFKPEPIDANTPVPFGVAICLGTFMTLIAGWLGYASPAEMLTP